LPALHSERAIRLDDRRIQVGLAESDIVRAAKPVRMICVIRRMSSWKLRFGRKTYRT
jgi:hypothetical protein